MAVATIVSTKTIDEIDNYILDNFNDYTNIPKMVDICEYIVNNYCDNNRYKQKARTIHHIVRSTVQHDRYIKKNKLNQRYLYILLSYLEFCNHFLIVRKSCTVKDNVCSLCFCEMNKGESVQRCERCKKCIHASCFVEYKKHDFNKCPSCRHKIYEADIYKL